MANCAGLGLSNHWKSQNLEHGMKIDQDNKEFSYGIKLIENTRKNVFVTGKAGTGKTTFLHQFVKNTTKKFIIVAPTGVAAINAGGVTIQSFFQIPPGVFTPDNPTLGQWTGTSSKIHDEFRYGASKKDLLKNIDLVIIDEISMVRCDILDLIDRLLRVFGGGDSTAPFGGKQMVFIGDAFQLPPVSTFDVSEIIRRFYKTDYFFGAQSYTKSAPVTVELKKIYRQKEDRLFTDILNRIRIGEHTPEDIQVLNSKVDGSFDFAGYDYVFLASHKNIVHGVNQERLDLLPNKELRFMGDIKGTFKENDLPTDLTLRLKEGAQVMFVKNDPAHRYYNGLIAKVKSIDHNCIIIETKEGREIVLEKATWTKIRYEWNKEEHKVNEIVEGSFTQYPIKLAWAITVHKSQGLTFDEIYVDLLDAFAPGQVYVGLSRCTSLSGIKLKRHISDKSIKVSPEVIAFYKSLESSLDTISKVPKIVSFTSDTLIAQNGDFVTLSWAVTDAHRIEISTIGQVAGVTSLKVKPLRDTIYILTAYDEVGVKTAKASLRVEVSKTPPIILSFSSQVDYVFAGQQFAVSWVVKNASIINILYDNQDLPVSADRGNLMIAIHKRTTITLVASTCYGVTSKQAIEVEAIPMPIIERISIPNIEVNCSLNLSIVIPPMRGLENVLPSAFYVDNLSRLSPEQYRDSQDDPQSSLDQVLSRIQKAIKRASEKSFKTSKQSHA